MPENWENIHFEFTPRLRELWERHGFVAQQAQQWINKGLQPIDYDLVNYLKEKGYDPKQELDLTQLRKEHENNLDWKNIHNVFTKKIYRDSETNHQEWEKLGISYQEAKQWIELGFNAYNHQYAKRWKENDFTLKKIKGWIKAGFTPYDVDYAKKWRELGFTSTKAEQMIMAGFKTNDYAITGEWRKKQFFLPQTIAWISVGLKPDEFEFANYLREKSYFPDNLNITEIIKKESWQDIHPDFNYQQRSEWEKEVNANHEETKEWIKLKFKPSESKRIKEWKEKGLNYSAAEQLLVAGLDNQFSWNNWKKLGFTIQQTKEWIEVGLSQWEYDLANYLQSKGLQPVNRDITTLKEEYKKIQEEATKTFNKLSIEVIEQIKDFEHSYNPYTKLTSEQQTLVDKLMLNQKLREQYQKYGLCRDCQQPNTYNNFDKGNWCQPCNAQHFAQGFDKWTSGNSGIDKLIRKCQLEAINNEQVLEWIPYGQFTNVEYLAEGGFGKVYKAEWINGYIKNWVSEEKRWSRESSDFHGKKKEKGGNKDVVLKILNNSQNTTAGFLQEVANYKLFNGPSSSNLEFIVKCFGISQDLQTKNYIIVMDYIPGGNARKYLNSHYEKLSFRDKISQLWTIASGLKNIHNKGLIHRDFHSGNILNYHRYRCYITDLGLCKPADVLDQENKEEIYGVLPYVAPEVLRGKGYSQASDIYSFGMVAYEVLSSLPPYYDVVHDEFLAVKICQGLRPNLKDANLPEPLKDLIERCWDANLSARPTTNELHKILYNWYWERNSEFYRQYLTTEGEGFDDDISCQSNPQAVYTSRLLDFKNLPEPQNSKEINEQFYKFSKPVEFDISMLHEELREAQSEQQEEQNNWTNLRPSFTSELTQSWINHNFTSEQVRHWINIGLTPSDYALAAWIRDTKQKAPEEILNFADLQNLKQEFQTYQQNQQTPQIIHKPA